MGDVLNVFVDECGNLPLSVEKSGTSNYFILTAVTIKQEHLSDIRKAIQQLSEQFFSKAPIESKRVADNHNKRTRLLDALIAIPNWKYHALIVDKQKLDPNGGFGFKRSFYKYFNRKLYEHLVNNSFSTSFTADEYGTSEFMAELKDYFQSRLSEGLLFALNGPPTISFSKCEIDCLLSLPDFIAGTWGKILEGSANNDVKKQWRAKISSSTKLIRIQSWPQDIAEEFFHPESTGRYDTEIRSLSLSKAYGFIHNNSDNFEESVKVQLDVLEYLLYRQIYDDSAEYVYAESIVNHLKSLGHIDITTDTLRYDVIAPLRNAGLFISSSRKGYKIALSEQDIVDFFQYSQHYILPLLSRVKKVSESMETASNGEIDLLAAFPKLKRIAQDAPEA